MYIPFLLFFTFNSRYHGLNHGIKEDPFLNLIQKCMLPVSKFCFINFINISCYKVIEGIFLLTVPRALVLLWIIFVNCVSCLSCFHVCSFLPCGHLLGKGCPLRSLVYDFTVFLLLSQLMSWVRCGA